VRAIDDLVDIFARPEPVGDAALVQHELFAAPQRLGEAPDRSLLEMRHDIAVTDEVPTIVDFAVGDAVAPDPSP
jgi:hypothetical protein